MVITTFEQAKIERDRILSSPRLNGIKALTVSGKGRYPKASTVMPIDEHFVFELVIELTNGGQRILKTTEDVDHFLNPG